MNEQLETFLTEFAKQCASEAEKAVDIAAEQKQKCGNSTPHCAAAIVMISLAVSVEKSLAAMKQITTCEKQKA